MTKRKRKPGVGHVRARKLKSGATVYDVLVKENGKQRAVECGIATPDEAEAVLFAYHEARAEDGNKPRIDPGILTVRQLGHLYLAAIPERTRDTDERRWNARVASAEFIDWPVVQLHEMTVRRWIDRMARTEITVGKAKGKRPSRGTLETALAVLRAALKYAVIHGHVTQNVAKNVTIGDSTLAAPKGTSAGEGFDYLREDEVKRLLEAENLPDRQRAAYVLLAFTGARPKDLYLLTWDRVDVGAATVRYRSHKRSRDYVVHLLPIALAAIREHWMKSGRPSRGLLFTGPDGSPHTAGYDWGWADVKGRKHWNWVVGTELRRNKSRAVKTSDGWRTKIGIRRSLPLYSLRHTCASHLLLGTPLFTGGRRWSMEEVASQLGHSDLSTVRRYCVALGLASMGAVEESRVALGAPDPKPVKKNR